MSWHRDHRMFHQWSMSWYHYRFEPKACQPFMTKPSAASKPEQTGQASPHDTQLHTCWGKIHNDVIKWKHFSRHWPFVWGSHRWIPRTKGQWCGALMFPLICTWIYVSANNHEAGDLRRHRAHYVVTVMCRQESDFQLIFDPWIQLIRLDGSRIKVLADMTAVNLCIYPSEVTWGQWGILFQYRYWSKYIFLRLNFVVLIKMFDHLCMYMCLLLTQNLMLAAMQVYLELR